MISKQGRTLQGVGLTQGNIQKSDGLYEGATTFHCHTDGTLKIHWVNGASESFSFVAGDAFPISCKAVEVTAGTFSIGFD